MKKILVIEDDERFLLTTMELLLLSDYDVQGCADGKSGVQKALQFLPDLILCDIDLPDLDGFGILQVLRRSIKLKNVLFIFMTGVAKNQNFRYGMNLGADDFIFKPFTGTELLKAVSCRFDRLKDCMESSTTQLAPANTRINGNPSALHPLFSGIPSTFLKRGTQLYRTGQSISFIPYLVEGMTRTARSDRTGKEFSTSIIKAGQLVGLADSISGLIWREDAFTMSDALVASVPVEDLTLALENDVQLKTLVIQQLANSLNLKNEESFVMAYQHLRGKVGYALLNLREHYLLDDQEEPFLRITRPVLSTFAGVAKESVTRTLIDFMEEGLIEESHKGFKILNPAKLAILAGR